MAHASPVHMVPNSAVGVKRAAKPVAGNHPASGAVERRAQGNESADPAQRVAPSPRQAHEKICYPFTTGLFALRPTVPGFGAALSVRRVGSRVIR